MGVIINENKLVTKKYSRTEPNNITEPKNIHFDFPGD